MTFNSSALCVSARFQARSGLTGGHWGYLDCLSGYRRPWRSRKHYNSKDKTLRTHRTGR